ncbi:hypothetical protein PTI98_011672 [Pleurotus ostreatus]|nr:hypothetical protein PTI98_011672 [Pleurotus ostreatus]
MTNKVQLIGAKRECGRSHRCVILHAGAPLEGRSNGYGDIRNGIPPSPKTARLDLIPDILVRCTREEFGGLSKECEDSSRSDCPSSTFNKQFSSGDSR